MRKITSASTKLEEEVQEILNEKIETGYPIESILDDLCKHGCQSGMIGSLVYYDDTRKFFDRNVDEINEYLSELTDTTGFNLYDLLVEKGDKYDPLVRNDINKNLVVWLVFEEIAYRFYNEIEEAEQE